MESRVKDRLKFLIRELGDDEDDAAPTSNTLPYSPKEADEQSVTSEAFTDLSDITASDSIDLAADLHHSRSRLPPRGSESASQIHLLEEKVLRLTRDKTRMQAQYEQDMRAKNMETIKLYEDLKRIEQRQEQVEAKAPLLAQQVQQAKLALNDLKISEEAYLELKSMPLEKLSVPEHVRVSAT
jgi:hypothetical protein